MCFCLNDQFKSQRCFELRNDYAQCLHVLSDKVHIKSHGQPSTSWLACFSSCRSASMTAARFFPLDRRCCWINQPIILLSLTPPGTPHGTCRPVAGPSLHPASHLLMPPLAQDAPAGRISQVTVSDTLVIRLGFHLFLGLNPRLYLKKMEVL